MNRRLICTVPTLSLAAASCPSAGLDINNYCGMALLQTLVYLNDVPLALNSSNASELSRVPWREDRGRLLPKREAAPERSSWAELGLAVLWCLMVGLSPFILTYLKGRTLSRRGMVSSSLVTCWVIFGVITCKYILFSSDHFDGIRSLTLGESVYFMSQVITTVGYGDITPEGNAAQASVAVLVMWAVLVVADALAQAASIMADRLDKAQRCEQTDPVSLQKAHLLAALKGHLVVVVVWVAVLSLAYGWTLEASLFSSIATLTTVGFGHYTPSQKGAQLFTAFWMLIGTASMGNMVSAFGGLMKTLTDEDETDQK